MDLLSLAVPLTPTFHLTKRAALTEQSGNLVAERGVVVLHPPELILCGLQTPVEGLD